MSNNYNERRKIDWSDKIDVDGLKYKLKRTKGYYNYQVGDVSLNRRGSCQMDGWQCIKHLPSKRFGVTGIVLYERNNDGKICITIDKTKAPQQVIDALWPSDFIGQSDMLWDFDLIFQEL